MWILRLENSRCKWQSKLHSLLRNTLSRLPTIHASTTSQGLWCHSWYHEHFIGTLWKCSRKLWSIKSNVSIHLSTWFTRMLGKSYSCKRNKTQDRLLDFFSLELCALLLSYCSTIHGKSFHHLKEKKLSWIFSCSPSFSVLNPMTAMYERLLPNVLNKPVLISQKSMVACKAN